MSGVFPPEPRSSLALVADVLGDLAALPDAVGFGWEPVRFIDLDSPWVGVRVPTLACSRPWVWDVVTPEDHYRDERLRQDPLALAVGQDTVIVDLHRADDAGFALRLQVPVLRVPTRIDVPASALLPPPWTISLSTGWTSAAIDVALDRWPHDLLGVHRPGPVPKLSPDDCSDRLQVGDGLYAEDASFDVLLRLPTEEAAAVTGFFGALAEALASSR